MIWENIRGLASIFIVHSCWVHENFKMCASWRDGVLDFNPRNFQENVSQSSIRTAESIENVFYGLPDVLNAQPTPNSRGEMLIWSWRQFYDVFVVPQAFIKKTNEFLKENLKILHHFDSCVTSFYPNWMYSTTKWSFSLVESSDNLESD